MKNYLTCLHLLTPLHTGGSSQEGNLMGIAREVHTEFPYLPASSLRGKIRSEVEGLDTSTNKTESNQFFGQKIKNGEQPTEGEVWFADATLIAFPIASLSHQIVWITCPLWLARLNRWLTNKPLTTDIKSYYEKLANGKMALVTFETSQLSLQTAQINNVNLERITLPNNQELTTLLSNQNSIFSVINKLVILSDEDCIALIETGLQREVRVALNEGSKTAKDGSFRSEEAVPPEAILFFPWGTKSEPDTTKNVRQSLINLMKKRLQLGGLESLGRGWTDLTTIEVNKPTK